MANIQTIDIRGARVHNLKDINVSVPLHQIVGIAGVSGSGKSSLALGVLYAEGSRRYLDSLSTYTRRRMTMASKATVDEVLHVPAALALRQRPGIAGIRSTFGTSTELLNSLRLMFSRLASHVCPNGHHVPPSLMVAAEKELVCPTCGARFYGPSAEDLSFNGAGACPSCSGTGIVRTVDRSTLVPDENLTIEEGAVVVWGSLMWSLMVDVCREMGVRTNVPFKDLTDKEKDLYSAIETYWLNATSNQQRFIAAKSNVESQQENNDLISEQFRLGLKDIVELTTSRSSLLQAKQEMLESKYMTLLNVQLLKFYSGEEIKL